MGPPYGKLPMALASKVGKIKGDSKGPEDLASIHAVDGGTMESVGYRKIDGTTLPETNRKSP